MSYLHLRNENHRNLSHLQPHRIADLTISDVAELALELLLGIGSKDFKSRPGRVGQLNKTVEHAAKLGDRLCFWFDDIAQVGPKMAAAEVSDVDGVHPSLT